ncbi:MAG: uncharacterized protein JWN04_1021, partial [Myxococcaceae bacterium]|nr:uncharacterized protein [Myxococcaceae bacterium]
MRKHPSAIHSLLALALVAATGCSDSGSASPPDPNNPDNPNGPLKTTAESFESDLPSGAASSSSSRGGAVDAASSTAGKGEQAPIASAPAPHNADVAADATRAIVEADIIQVDGQRLYALSRVAGLTIIDLTDPSHLSILGRFRELNGTPFEMYLRNGVVLAMYSGWGQYTKQADSWAWVQTSKVIALDVGTPSAISVAGTFDVAGEISDSRIVGDVMYVVGYQDGYCWNCDQNKPQTSVLSLSIKDPHKVSKVDELKFADANNSYGWNKRSITVTDQRMYVAGPEYGQNMPTGSTIQVIDISDPTGDLVEGATVQAAGQISSRWQMNEYQGVLRVISQVPSWWSSATERPSVQTFKVTSSQSVTKLASTPLSIPASETLNTVQFDGPRGYAVTSQRTDPLFTIDLSDPSNPKQVGMVEMPGSLYYLAARGDRVIGLGFDQGNPGGGVTVTVFDVSNLASPKLLDRVNFGGSWASLPEDQDRIQKAFKILDDQGLILVPFSGWNYTDTKGYCYNTYRSGTQLIDLKGDDLSLRGAAPSRGEARRAFLHNEKLLTVSDEAIDTYDISNRDAPTEAGRLTIARYVSHALPLANQTVARINENWYGQQASTIDFVPLASADRPDLSSSELNLSQLLSDNPTCNTYAWIQDAYVSGNQVNVTYERYKYDANNSGNGQMVNGILSIDAT